MRYSRWFAVLAAAMLAAGGVSAGYADTTASADTNTTADLPSSFQWSSTGPLIGPKPDATHDAVSFKDPSVVRYEGEWLVYGTTASESGGWNLVYTHFSDWSQASSAPHYYLDRSAIGSGYRAAPQVFYFEPRDKWYLVYQTGVPSYSTTDDPSDPSSWSEPRNLMDSMPDIVADNIGDGHWVDFWVTCDAAMCYLFSSDDNGHLYRAETTLGQFPHGFGDTQIAVWDTPEDLFEASNVYKVAGTGKYLLLVEAIGSDGRRWFRSWTSDSIDGFWNRLADTEQNPFARSNNVTFPGGEWTADISHGELIRSGVDQTMTIDPCQLRFLYQGKDPEAGGDYSQLPYQLGLLTQTNSSC
ncbi:Glycosyl hydrolase family 62 [Actinopolyspora xinjiangensis]|uniref:non-reducing end alpha-L-arabinofuranosidase n=1 Tax=Actinopolyspora xinjiangensis TaxID=405564 RepID=A0A1H0W1J8_9ACTN|nr:non-reducing end alpha-L-arabinofuranosidase family hydrolase [Actinopolyspora xinjiangensis]SDP84246.1 Glycosyl hydrolase family 62 [Actinopolyspora xinjiangensis]